MDCMNVYNHQQSGAAGSGSRGASATLVARVSESERAGITHLARVHDRTPSREIRRAIRFYLTNFDLADRALREQAGSTDAGVR